MPDLDNDTVRTILINSTQTPPKADEEVCRAQWAYDLREKFEFCSGTDLHEFFAWQTGEPSPSGKESIALRALVDFIQLSCWAMSKNSAMDFKSLIQPIMDEIEEYKTDPLQMMISKHPEAMTGECKKLKLSWVIGQGYSFMVSESYLGGFLMEPIRVILVIKHWFEERKNNNAR